MTVGNLALSNRPAVLAHVCTGDTELTLTIHTQHRWNVAMRAVQLEVRARIGAGPWGPIKHLGFTVRSAWWQGRWFLALAGLGLLGVLAGAFHLRQRAVLSRQTRRLHEQSTAELLGLLEALPDLITVHRDGKMTYVNEAAQRILCRSPSEIPDLASRTHPDSVIELSPL